MMSILSMVCFACLQSTFSYLASGNTGVDVRITKHEMTSGEYWHLREGEICRIGERPVSSRDKAEYYNCTVPTMNANEWPWQELGLWTLMSCPDGLTFSERKKRCSRNVQRRLRPTMCAKQPAMPICARRPGPPVIPVPCPTANDEIACPGCPCSWMLTPLITNPSTPHGFLQCIPHFPGLYCGTWSERPCAPGTRFDIAVQVCVHDECLGRACGRARGQMGHGGPFGVTGSFGPIRRRAAPKPVPGSTCETGGVVVGMCNVEYVCPSSAVCEKSSMKCCQRTSHEQSSLARFSR